MYQKIKLNFSVLAFSMLLSAGCNATATEFAPYFNKDNQSGAFFDNALILKSASDFSSALEKNWDYPTDLKHKTLGKKSVSSCQQLKKSINDGFTAAKVYEHKFVSAQSTICSLWKHMAAFKAYKISHLGELPLNKDFAKQAPASLALVISDEQEKKVKMAASWNDFSKIKKVTSHSKTKSTFYDNSGGIQRLSLMAKGDYNGDGIEDRLLFMENSVEGGSYSSTNAYIITRVSPGAPITLLKEI